MHKEGSKEITVHGIPSDGTVNVAPDANCDGVCVPFMDSSRSTNCSPWAPCIYEFNTGGFEE